MLAFACVAAFTQRFIVDDAFISLRYAENWVNGHGLVWNVGERVEGYTSPSWTVLLALPLALGLDPIGFVYAIGPLLLCGTLLLSTRLAEQLLRDRISVLVAIGLLATTPTLLAYATAGLETQLLALLITALFCLSTRPAPLSFARASGISLLAAACLLTRLDAAWILADAGVMLLHTESQRARLATERAKLIATLVLPALLVLGAWLAWKWQFYGELLPNTFYAKTEPGLDTWISGTRFVLLFFTSYLLWPSLLLVMLRLPRVLRTGEPGLAAITLSLGMHYVYIASVGGDFMEFRFFVPTLPLLYIAIGAALQTLSHTWLRALIVASVLAGSASHYLLFDDQQGGVESVRVLASHLDPQKQDWIGIGNSATTCPRRVR